MQYIYLTAVIREDADDIVVFERRLRLMWACNKRFGQGIYNTKTSSLGLKVRMKKAEEVMTLLYSSVTRIPNATDNDKL